MDLRLMGKTALVTGSSSGIGEGIAKCLAREGVRVMLHGRNQTELERVAKEIEMAGGLVSYVIGDLAKDVDATYVADTTLQTFQRLDILVNNAGAFPIRGWLEASSQDWLDLFNVNVVSMVRMVQAFVPQMKELGWGALSKLPVWRAYSRRRIFRNMV